MTSRTSAPCSQASASEEEEEKEENHQSINQSMNETPVARAAVITKLLLFCLPFLSPSSLIHSFIHSQYQLLTFPLLSNPAQPGPAQPSKQAAAAQQAGSSSPLAHSQAARQPNGQTGRPPIPRLSLCSSARRTARQPPRRAAAPPSRPGPRRQCAGPWQCLAKSSCS